MDTYMRWQAPFNYKSMSSLKVLLGFHVRLLSDFGHLSLKHGWTYCFTIQKQLRYSQCHCGCLTLKFAIVVLR